MFDMAGVNRRIRQHQINRRNADADVEAVEILDGEKDQSCHDQRLADDRQNLQHQNVAFDVFLSVDHRLVGIVDIGENRNDGDQKQHLVTGPAFTEVLRIRFVSGLAFGHADG